MTGKILTIAIVVCSIIAGAALYYLQVYAFYDDVTEVDLQATTLDGNAIAVATPGWEGIDAESSPIRFRGCFDAEISLTDAQATLEPYDTDPRNAPDWFQCFDATALGSMIDAGTAQVFLGTRNLEYGIDRVIAFTADGRGYVWHDVNECGDKLYDGSPAGEDCPDR